MDNYIDPQTGIEYSADKKILLSCPDEYVGELHIPEGVEVIEEQSLSFHQNITALYIPASVREIKYLGVCGCKKLRKIVVDSNNNVYDSRNNCNAIIETATCKVVLGCTSTHIFEGIKEIGDFSFSHQLISNITIPRSVVKIGGCAFADCEALVNVTFFPKTNIAIHNYAFVNCHLLSEVTLYPGIKYVHDDGVIFHSFDPTTKIIKDMNARLTIWDTYGTIGQMLQYIYEQLSRTQLKVGGQDFAFNGGKQWAYVYQVLLKYNKDTANQIVIHSAKEFCQELKNQTNISLEGLSPAAFSGELKEVVNWSDAIAEWKLDLDYISARKLSVKQRESNLAKGKEIAFFVENLLQKLCPM